MDTSQRFYKLLVDSFRDRLVIRDVIKDRYDKARKRFIKSYNHKRLEERTETYLKLKRSYERFNNELMEDISTFFEQRHDSLDETLTAVILIYLLLPCSFSTFG